MADYYLNLARETTFKTAPATGWVGVGVEDLGGHEPIVVNLQPNARYYGQQGQSTRGRRTLVRGGTGTIKPYLISTGLQLLLDAVFGEPTVTVLAADEAWQYVYETSLSPSATSIAAQAAREFQTGGRDRDTFTGGQVTEMRLSQAMTPMSSGVTDEGLAKLEFDVNYAKLDTTVIERLPTYPDPEVNFSGGDHQLLIGPDLDNLEAECLQGWALTYNTGLDIENAACLSTVNRDLAGRGPLPSGKIEASWTYKGRDYYDAWLNGDILAMRSIWTATGVEIATGVEPSVQVDIAAFGLTGATAKESATEATKQDLPSDVLWNHTDPMITVTVVSSEAPYVAA